MRVVITSERDMLRNQERARVVAPQQKASQVIGALEAARLLDKREFIYRGRPYRVPPLPWPLAAELLDVQAKLRATSEEYSLDETLKVFERAARLSKRACRPAGLVRRVLWPLTTNPFRLATPWQVGRTLGFFSMCLVLDGDLLGTPDPSRSHGTSSPISRPSSPGSQRGPAGTATRSPGPTS